MGRRGGRVRSGRRARHTVKSPPAGTPRVEVETTPDMARRVYDRLAEAVPRYREAAGGRPLTLAEKVIAGHLEGGLGKGGMPRGGRDYVFLRPDRVALQDVTGQMVMLQFISAGQRQASLPTTIHCDHLIRAKVDGDHDMEESLGENGEVFRFLESAASKYGCGFWRPGAGIIHQVVLENYAFPGGLMIGTDSHTPNAGGLGMMAVGVGGIDAAEAMAGMPWEVLFPRRIGVRLTGRLGGWAAPKDVILRVASELTVSGGTNAVVEYFGPGAGSISCTGKATIANMGAEIGATCSVFPYDPRMEAYLRATGRGAIADLASSHAGLLAADAGVGDDPGACFDRVVEIDLSELEPHIAGPHTPDLARPISGMAGDVAGSGYVDRISAALVGSCTNSSYEDMSRAAAVASQAAARGARAATPLLVTPGSEQVRATIERDGQMGSLRSVGATVLANACGPCIGQWSRPEIEEGRENTIVTSFNRNFPGRNDGSRSTMNFIASPEVVVALALGGRLSFNPLVDELEAADGSRFRLEPPGEAADLPRGGFEAARGAYAAPSPDPDSVSVDIDPSSSRLQVLEPFAAWDGSDACGPMPVLAKAAGKCTTDHISPAGAWLSYRGHLDNLSDNMLLGAVSAFDGTGVGRAVHMGTGREMSCAEAARAYKRDGVRWVVVGGANYGEGSSREHAAMTPRHLGCAAVVAQSFARIHETNLKKQGILALTFADASDYGRVRAADDTVALSGISSLAPGSRVRCTVGHSDGSSDSFDLSHSYSALQVEWFRAGAALNVLRGRGGRGGNGEGVPASQN